LRVVFAIVVLAAFVFYSIMDYSPWLCAIFCNALVLALVIAATGVAMFHGTKRMFSVGFLAAAILCAWAAFGKSEPGTAGNQVGFGGLSGTESVDWLYEHLHGFETPRFLVPWSVRAGTLQAGEGGVWRQGADHFETKDGRRYYSRDVFETTVYGLFVIAVALISGVATAVVGSIAHGAQKRKTVSRRSLGPTSP
jgi:hypothetical protein